MAEAAAPHVLCGDADSSHTRRTQVDSMPYVQSEDLVLASLHKDRITVSDIARIEDMCYARVAQDDLYSVRNDAKLRAVYTSRSYEEFKDIVDAAHLRPLDKADKKTATTRSRLWNSAAKG